MTPTRIAGAPGSPRRTCVTWSPPTCAARDNDPEILPKGSPPSTFDAGDAVSIVGSVLDDVAAQRWDQRFFPLSTREEVRAYCRHNHIPAERAETAALPLWLMKRGVLVRALKR